MERKNYKLLIVDDEAAQRELLAGFFTKRGYVVRTADSVASATKLFDHNGFDVAILDLRLPDGEGVDLLAMLRAKDPELGAIILTAYATIGKTAQGMRAGAADFLEKPVDLAQLERVIEQLCEKRQKLSENRELQQVLTDAPQILNVVAESAHMREILNIVARVAETDAPVMITGESGTGKEVIARAIHAGSLRRDRTFMAINCAAIPETLLESELFGYEGGAFTGAKKRTPGKLELGSGGSVFLDEIGDFPPILQAKLLRFLEDGKFFRLGGSEHVQPDVRIISATNRNIESMVKSGTFREDLFYRLNLIRIHIPPLRERSADLLALADMFLRNCAQKYGKDVKGFSPDARDVILRRQWAGNVRELKNAVERAVILARTELLPAELFAQHDATQEIPDAQVCEHDKLFRTLEEMERTHIISVLEHCAHNQTEAARILGVHRNTLRNKLKDYGIDAE